jgi:hypothetical protein
VGHFHAGTEEEFVRSEPLFHFFQGIVLILDIPYDGLHHILHGEHACGTAEFVHHHGHVGALLDEHLQRLIRRHGARYEVHRTHDRPDGTWIPEQFVTVNIAQ